MHRSYGDVRAVSGVSMDLLGGVTVLLGRNGSGKSTVSRLVAGAEEPDAGRVIRGGRATKGPAARRAHLRRTGWLPQTLSVPKSLTVRQYVSYAGWLKDLGGRALARSVEAALEAADLMDIADRRMGQLSGGMVRRSGIAQAIVNDGDLLVLDEPTAGLDPEQRATFHGLIRRIAINRSVLVSTHLLEDVVAVGDRTVVLDQGRVRFQGSIPELMLRGGEVGDASARLRAGFLEVLAASGV